MTKLFKRRAQSDAPHPPGAPRLPNARLEARREALLLRLEKLGESTKQSPGYRSALTLLNRKFRLAKVPAKLGILQAAQFMIEVLELMPMA